MATEKQYRVQVKRGAKLMDKEYPGWEKVVKLSSLDLGDGYMCILGQTVGEYDPYKIGLTYDEAELKGFDIDIFRSTDWDKDYALMTRLWKEEIRARRAKAKGGKGAKTIKAK